MSEIVFPSTKAGNEVDRAVTAALQTIPGQVTQLDTRVTALENDVDDLQTLPAQLATIGLKIGDLTQLETDEKSNLVGAINEVNSDLDNKVVDIYKVLGEEVLSPSDIIIGDFIPGTGTINYNETRRATLPAFNKGYYSKLICHSGYQYAISGNDVGMGNAFEQITGWGTGEKDLSSINKNYIAIRFKKDDDSAFTNEDLDSIASFYRGSSSGLIQRVEEIEDGIPNIDSKIGDLSKLKTEEKDNLVDAINEVNDSIGLQVDVLKYATGIKEISGITMQTGYYYALNTNKQIVLRANEGSQYSGEINISNLKAKKVAVVLRFVVSTASARCIAITDENDVAIASIDESSPTITKNGFAYYILESKDEIKSLWISARTQNVFMGAYSWYANLDEIEKTCERIDAINDLIGEKKEVKYTSQIGEAILAKVPIEIAAGQAFSVYGNIPRGIVTSDSYNILGFTTSALDGYQAVTLFSGFLDEIFSKDYVATQKFYGIGLSRGAASVISSDEITLGVDAAKFQPRSAKLSDVVYVDAVNGSDENLGTKASPFKTFAKALNETGEDTTIVLSGDISEFLNVKKKNTQRSITLIGEMGKLNRILGGTKIDSAIQYQGDVYYKDLSSFPSAQEYHIFQHEIADASTLISDDERHPLQRGREYRCESTLLLPSNSLQDVIDADGQTYYWDSTNSRLYFKIANGSSLADSPIYLPNGSGIYNNDGSVKLNICNIETWYCNFNLTLSHNAEITDCASKFAYAAGGFVYDNAIGVVLKRCEAARVFSGSTSGDGFNAHSNIISSYSTNNPQAKHTTCIMVDCWSHDNNDDGYSDHERCETSIHGGLFEYNGKAGVTPSFGSHLVGYNILSRKNNNGFYYVGAATTLEGGKYGQMELYGCVAEHNTIGAGYAVGGEGNLMRLINCKSLEDRIGFWVQQNTTAELVDCSCYNPTEGAKFVGTGAILTIKNTTTVNV